MKWLLAAFMVLMLCGCECSKTYTEYTYTMIFADGDTTNVVGYSMYSYTKNGNPHLFVYFRDINGYAFARYSDVESVVLVSRKVVKGEK